jgi:hypothetical protein
VYAKTRGQAQIVASPRVTRNIRHRRFFPKQEEKMDNIEQIIDSTKHAAFAGIKISLAAIVVAVLVF